MGKGRDISSILRPLESSTTQVHLGTGLHTLGLLGWILNQTGKADVYVTTFSTSDPFLSGFLRLKRKKLIGHSVLLADLKASRKTIQLYKIMQACFDDVYLSMNHSKIVLVKNDNHTVAVISSQNQTYGDRAECTLITTCQETYDTLFASLQDFINNHSKLLNGLFSRIDLRDREEGGEDDDADGDCCTP